MQKEDGADGNDKHDKRKCGQLQHDDDEDRLGPEDSTNEENERNNISNAQYGSSASSSQLALGSQTERGKKRAAEDSAEVFTEKGMDIDGRRMHVVVGCHKRVCWHEM